MLESLRRRIAAWIAPRRTGQAAVRMYHAAKQSRLTSGWYASETSADAELHSSLRTLRGRSRQLVRDAGYAKRAKVVVVNNVIGSGVGMQANIQSNRGRLRDEVNDPIESAWAQWCVATRCHTGGRLHFGDLERQCMGQIFEAGEVLVRMHLRAFGDSQVPLALELIEAERLADNYNVAPGPGNRVRMGVEVDEYDRPVGYWLRTGHPGDLHGSRADAEKLIRVPADQVLHLYVCDRWPQTRGEPWLHAAARKLNDLDGYSEAEIVAARNSACYMGFIQPPEGDAAAIVDDVSAETGEQFTEMEPGLIRKLQPGETFTSYTPTRPNTGMDGFIRAMLREVAAAIGTSYESLSRDYSQSNYSSSRLALLDDRDLWKTLQQWWVRAFREPLHRVWLRQAVLSRAIRAISVEEYIADPARWESVRWKPRGWSWVDPTKEVAAYKDAVLSGFMTVADVISQTSSSDLEDVMKARRQELDMMDELDLEFETSPKDEPAPAPAPAAAPAGEVADPAEPQDDPEEDDGAEPARLYAYPTR